MGEGENQAVLNESALTVPLLRFRFPPHVLVFAFRIFEFRNRTRETFTRFPKKTYHPVNV